MCLNANQMESQPPNQRHSSKNVNTTRSRIEFRFLARARYHSSQRACVDFRQLSERVHSVRFLPIYAEWIASSAIELSIKWEKSSDQRQKNHLQYAHTQSSRRRSCNNAKYDSISHDIYLLKRTRWKCSVPSANKLLLLRMRQTAVLCWSRIGRGRRPSRWMKCRHKWRVAQNVFALKATVDNFQPETQMAKPQK